MSEIVYAALSVLSGAVGWVGKNYVNSRKLYQEEIAGWQDMLIKERERLDEERERINRRIDELELEMRFTNLLVVRYEAALREKDVNVEAIRESVAAEVGA